MSGELITTLAGRCLPDAQMRLWDPKTKTHSSPDWEKLDRAFERVSRSLHQVATTQIGDFVHVIVEHTPVSNQGQIGSCVANSWCDMHEILMGLENPNNVVQLSRRFAYFIARFLTGDTGKDDGTYLRSMAHQFRAIGVVDEQFFPYSDKPEDVIAGPGKSPAEPELDLYTMASNNRIESFYRLTSKGEQLLDDLELAIRSNHPVAFAAPVGDDFMAYRGGGHVLGPPALSRGAHAMLVVGVRTRKGKREWYIRNSWGLGWGDAGHVWVSSDYVAQFSDIWVGTQMKGLV